MHRRWMSLPLLTSCISAFYPYTPSVDDGTSQHKRFIPYHPPSYNPEDGLVAVDIHRVPKRDNTFSVVLSNPTASPNSMPIDQDGSDYSYFSSMKFGSKGQKMYMLIDSGSANTWVMSQTCASKSCGLHSLFGSDDSTTLVTNASNKWSLTYGSGSVSGIIASDTVAFANFTVNMGFGLADIASDDFINYPMDGILGLGRTTSDALGVPTVMQVLGAQGKLAANVYAVHVTRSSDNTKDGEIIFGGTDSARYTGSISYTKTSNAASWEIPVDDAFVNGTPCGLTGKQAIVDTGTSYVLMPPADAQTLHKLIPGSTQNGETFNIPCSTTANIQVSFSGVKYSISPKDYVGGNSGDGVCSSNIIGHQAFGSNEWILGDVFLKNVYTVFDFDQAAVGFATPVSGSNSASSSASSHSTTMSATASGTGSKTASATSGSKTSSPPSSASQIGNPFDVNGGSSSGGSKPNSASKLIPISAVWTVILVIIASCTI